MSLKTYLVTLSGVLVDTPAKEFYIGAHSIKQAAELSEEYLRESFIKSSRSIPSILAIQEIGILIPVYKHII